MEKLKEGTIIYLNTGYEVAEKCKIVPYKPGELDELKLELEDVEHLYKVYSIDTSGTFYTYEKDIFMTEKDAIEAYKKKHEQQIEEYLNKINSLADLLYFPLEHCINGDENTDCAAKAAYCIKIKEFI